MNAPLPFQQSVICPVVVGRADYLDSLTQQIEQTRQGRGATVLLAGEAGIGKSRLVREAKIMAQQAGFAVRQGNCFEPDRVVAYAPLLDLVRAMLAGSPTVDSATIVQPLAAELSRLLSELAPHLPDAALSPAATPEEEKRRLFDNLVRVFTAQPTPLLLIVEDLHWCDELSLEFLLTLARQSSRRPLLLLLTYRNDETTTALRQCLSSFDRARLAIELPLHRLSAYQTKAMIQATIGQATAVDREFAERIYALTEGNPFFVEELLKSLIASGEISFAGEQWTHRPTGALHVPRTVQVAVAQRLGQLSAAAQQVLMVAAVTGRRFDFSLLQAITGHSEAELLQRIKELMRSQLVVEESADVFAFRHALTQQAIYADLLQRERRSLHRMVAETLERLAAAALDTQIDALAFHYHHAGVWHKSLLYAHRAGQRSGALYAPHAAVEYFTHAIEAITHAPELAAGAGVAVYRGAARPGKHWAISTTPAPIMKLRWPPRKMRTTHKRPGRHRSTLAFCGRSETIPRRRLFSVGAYHRTPHGQPGVVGAHAQASGQLAHER